MDKHEARRLLHEQLVKYELLTHAELGPRIGELEAFELEDSERRAYQVEIQIVWDGKPGGAIRVLGAIDDGGWSAFAPLSDDVLVLPGPLEPKEARDA